MVSPTAALKHRLMPDFRQLHQLMASPAALLVPARRAALAPKIIPVMRNIVRKLDDFSHQHRDQAPLVSSLKYNILGMLILFGDKGALARVEAASKNPGVRVRALARLTLDQAAWLKDSRSAKKQRKILASVSAMAGKDPKNDAITKTLLRMSRLGAANKALGRAPLTIIKTQLKGPVAKAVVAQLQNGGQGPVDAYKGRAVTVSGVTLQGKKFSTGAWRGKVVFVDFWATWCMPCRASLPTLEKLYAKYHSKGLEVVGVSNDNSANALRRFLKAHPQMAWPQLLNVNRPGWSAISRKFGVTGIPTQMIIDRQGIVRRIVVDYSGAAEAANAAEVRKLLAQKTHGRKPGR